MTQLITDRKFLSTQMYSTDEALAVRLCTHKCYTQPQLDFITWVVERISWRGDETVLDVGCGDGAYVEPVCARLTEDGRLLSADISLGMLYDVNAKTFAGQPRLFNADAMTIPLPDACCDVVLANHMLYHVPLIERALAEIRRVLRPGGRLPCNTHGGQLSEAYIHGVNGIVEATRLVRGTSLNQPSKDVNHALVTSGVGIPTGGAILGKMN